MHPDPAERGDTNGPGRHRSQNCLPRHRLLPGGGVRVDRVLLDVLLLAQTDPRMGFGTVERQQVPDHAPGDAYRSGGVKDGPPAQVGDQEPCQRIGDAYADAEALETAHEPAAFRHRDPVAHQCVHGWPRQSLIHKK